MGLSDDTKLIQIINLRKSNFNEIKDSKLKELYIKVNLNKNENNVENELNTISKFLTQRK